MCLPGKHSENKNRENAKPVFAGTIVAWILGVHVFFSLRATLAKHMTALLTLETWAEVFHRQELPSFADCFFTFVWIDLEWAAWVFAVASDPFLTILGARERYGEECSEKQKAQHFDRGFDRY